VLIPVFCQPPILGAEALKKPPNLKNRESKFFRPQLIDFPRFAQK
jgi:hypothetical protein